MTLEDYIRQIVSCESIDALWPLHCEHMAAFGFDRLLYGFTRYRTEHSLGAPQDLLILTNHPTEYTDRFIDDELYFNAPIVRWAAENTGACSWSWMAEHSHDLTPAERQVVEFNRSMQVTSGYTVSFHDGPSRRSKGAIALTGRAGMSQEEVDDIWARDGETILAMNNVAHLKIISLPYRAWRRQLTDRQRQALAWVGEGKTTQDIATIMGLTQATIEKHLRLAREALDADTTAQAVLKASFQNQIFVLDA